MTKSSCIVVVAFALSACASKPPPAYQWGVAAKINHIPMQGLPAAPQIVADERPLQLANFGSEERDEQRRAGIAAGAAGGAAYAGVSALAEIAPLCVVLPPLCVGLIAVGGAVGGAASAVTVVSPQEAAQLGAIIEKHATSRALAQRAASDLHNASNRGFPRLVIRTSTVVLVPTRDGVSFRLVAEAQGFPDAGQAWTPSVHLVPFPSRPAAGWLAADGRLLEQDVETALRVLRASILRTYLPYDHPR